MIGKVLTQLKAELGNEKNFIAVVEKVMDWNSERISLWAAEEVLNFVDDLLSMYKAEVRENEDKIIIILKFLKLLLSNTNNKDIFSSFDHLSDIIKEAQNFTIKILISEIYLIFQNSKTGISNLYL